MNFSSALFVFIFVPLCFVLCQLPGVKLRNGILIVASLLFYAMGDFAGVMLLLVSSVVNYLIGLGIDSKERSDGGRGALVALACVANIGLLVAFKYLMLFVDSANSILLLRLPVPEITTPIGISFFTFQSLSYVIDVYRRECPAQKSYWRLLLYICFFPQLVAGPIVKYSDICEKIEARQVTAEGCASGMRRFIVGLSKKLLITNTIAILVDSVFALPTEEISAYAAVLGAIAYTLQIYFDFSGYSDMAIGLARLFGFELRENFDYPLIALSIKDFWRRWHISLSNWFKNYLYIPLGGNRRGKLRTAVNKLIVFICTGLWHGANLTFLVWGLFHAAFLLLEDNGIIHASGKRFKPLRLIYTLTVVVFGFVIFRSPDLSYAVGYFTAMFTHFSCDATQLSLLLTQLTPLMIFTICIAVVASAPISRAVRVKLNSRLGEERTAQVFSLVTIPLLVLCILKLSSAGYNPFIYLRF